MKKRWLSSVLSAVMIFSLTGCSVNSGNSGSSGNAADSGSLIQSPQSSGSSSMQDGSSAQDSSSVSSESTNESVSQPEQPQPTGDKPVVYFTSDITPEGLVEVYEKLGWNAEGKVAVKLSTGEPPPSNYLRPELIKDLVQSVDGALHKILCKSKSDQANGGLRSKHLMISRS